MDIHDEYRSQHDCISFYVYEGTYDGRDTKWITKTEWDYKITIKNDGGRLYPVDSNGDFMTVLKKNDPKDIKKWNIYCKQT